MQTIETESSSILIISPVVILLAGAGSSVLFFRLLNVMSQHKDTEDSFYILSLILFISSLVILSAALISLLIVVYIFARKIFSYISIVFLRIIFISIAVLIAFEIASIIGFLIALGNEQFFKPFITENIFNIIILVFLLGIFVLTTIIWIMRVTSDSFRYKQQQEEEQEEEFSELKTLTPEKRPVYRTEETGEVLLEGESEYEPYRVYSLSKKRSSLRKRL